MILENPRITQETLERLGRVLVSMHRLWVSALLSLADLEKCAWIACQGWEGLWFSSLPTLSPGQRPSWPSTVLAVTSALTGSSLPTRATLFFLSYCLVWATSAFCKLHFSVLALCSGMTGNKSTMLVSDKCSYTQQTSPYVSLALKGRTWQLEVHGWGLGNRWWGCYQVGICFLCDGAEYDIEVKLPGFLALSHSCVTWVGHFASLSSISPSVKWK